MNEIAKFYKIQGDGDRIYKLKCIKGSIGYFYNPEVDAGWEGFSKVKPVSEKELKERILKLQTELSFLKNE